MKKIIGSLLVLGLGLMLLSGCQSASTSTSSSGSVPAASIASDLGTMAKNSLAMDNGVLGVVTVLSASGLKAATPAIPTYSATDGFWATSDSYSGSGITYDIQYKFKVWDAAGTEITTYSALQAVNSVSDISKIWTYTTTTYTYTGGSYTIKYGNSVTDPLKFDYAAGSLTGPITMSSSYSGTTYNITLTYNNLTTSANGYPNGSVSWSVSESGNTTAAGTITFNGTATATLTFTSGYSGTYTVNLDTGVVSSVN